MLVRRCPPRDGVKTPEFGAGNLFGWLVCLGLLLLGAAQRVGRAGHCCWTDLSPEPLPFCEGNFRSSPVLPPVKGDKYLMTSVVRLWAVGRFGDAGPVWPGCRIVRVSR